MAREEAVQASEARVDNMGTNVLKALLWKVSPAPIYRVDQMKEVWGGEDGCRFLNPGNRAWAVTAAVREDRKG